MVESRKWRRIGRLREVNVQPIIGTYKDGHIELDAPVAWPQGMKVEVAPADESGRPTPSLGLDERTWVETPENRAALIASMEAYDPPDMTPEEWADWEAGLKWIGDYTKEAVRREMGLEP
jgi:hypothetical protein